MVSRLLNLFNETHELKGELSTHFRVIAEELMLNHVLKVNDVLFEFTEIEFYYKNDSHHIDENTHAKPGQLTCGEFFFNGFGLDITFGNVTRNIYGGILIRGIRKAGTDEFCSGPMMVLETLMRSLGSVFTVNKQFCLIRHECQRELVLATPRIRLSKESETNELPYRFVKCIVKEHKFPRKEDAIREWLTQNPKEDSGFALDALGYNLRP